MKRMDTKLLPVSSIQVAERIRKDNGGLGELAGDIREHGLINPCLLYTSPERKLLIQCYSERAHLLWQDTVEDVCSSGKGREV